MSQTQAPSIHDIELPLLNGKPASLSAYAGKVVLAVNVASRCGLTPQYEGLQALHDKYSAKGFTVLGFPSNDFGGQEPGTAKEIAEFCRLTYDVTFPMFSKVVTKPGPDQSPIYSWLGQTGNLPKWNFSKYVVDKHGKIVAFFPSPVKPDAPELLDAIKKAMSE